MNGWLESEIYFEVLNYNPFSQEPEKHKHEMEQLITQKKILYLFKLLLNSEVAEGGLMSTFDFWNNVFKIPITETVNHESKKCSE